MRKWISRRNWLGRSLLSLGTFCYLLATGSAFGQLSASNANPVRTSVIEVCKQMGQVQFGENKNVEFTLLSDFEDAVETEASIEMLPIDLQRRAVGIDDVFVREEVIPPSSLPARFSVSSPLLE